MGGRTFERKASFKKGGGRIFEGGLIFRRLRYSDGLFLNVLISSLAKLTKTTLDISCFSPPSTILSANEQGVPLESYLQEVREQLEERREETEENQHQRQTRGVSDNAGLYQ